VAGTCGAKLEMCKHKVGIRVAKFRVCILANLAEKTAGSIMAGGPPSLLYYLTPWRILSTDKNLTFL
jgi:hypothetical protein